MSLLYIDGFDTYGDATDLARRWTLDGTPTFDTANQYSGVQSVWINEIDERLVRPVSFTDGKFVVGFAFRSDDIELRDIFSLRIGTGTPSLVLRLNANGTLFLNMGNGGATDTGTAVLVQDSWYYIEIKGEFANTTSQTCILKVDGTTDITIALGEDTLNGSQPTTLRFEKSGVGPVFSFDCLYVCDQEGSVNNDFLGAVTIEALLPNGNGYNSDFTGSDSNSVDNYLHVDEVSPDDDTSYIESLTVGHIDTFTYADLGLTPDVIHGVQVSVQAKKTDAASRQIKQIARPASTDRLGAVHTLGTSYAAFEHLWETNPEDSAAWEEADVNGAEFGIKVEA